MEAAPALCELLRPPSSSQWSRNELGFSRSLVPHSCSRTQKPWPSSQCTNRNRKIVATNAGASRSGGRSPSGNPGKASALPQEKITNFNPGDARKEAAARTVGNSSASRQQPRMVPIETALKRNSTVKVNGTVARMSNSRTVNGTNDYNVGPTIRSSTVKKKDVLAPTNGASVNGIYSMANASKVASSNLIEPLTKDTSRYDNATVLQSDEDFSWSKENYSSVKRTIDIWAFVLSLRARVYLDDAKWTYLGGFSEDKKKYRRQRTAFWVRESILQLGPTFIKLGQLSSTRSDLFPREFVDELSKLQDSVPAFSPSKAIALIESELGQPIDSLFLAFERQPIAAASLGQVHRAVLPNRERVAVKVQRPGLKKLFDIDLKNLKKIAEYFQNSETLGGPTRDWLGIYEECATILYLEIDYINEGRNADRFRRDFRNTKWVRVPQIFWDYTSHRVLTLEYAPGVKINNIALLDAGGFNRSLIARRAVESYLIQILKSGFFHADPHPGNLAIDVDGSLIYYDFGMMGDIKPFTREKLLQLFYSVYEKDAKKVSQILVDLGALAPTGDMQSVRRSIKFFLNNLMGQKPNEEATISAVGEDLFAISLDQPFRFPATFTFVLRAFSTLEGIGYTLTTDFSFAKVAAPYAQELLDIQNSQRNGISVVQELQQQAANARDAAIAMPMRIQKIDELMQQLDAGELKLRVRVLEAERAAKRASILQMATINTVAGAALLNIGITLTGQGVTGLATGSFVGAGLFLLLVSQAMKKVKRLDKFEKML